MSSLLYHRECVHAITNGQRQRLRTRTSLGWRDGRLSRVGSNSDAVLPQFGHKELVG